MPVLARVALVAFLLAGTYVRIAGVWRQVLMDDESHALRHLTSGYGHILSNYDIVASPIGTTLLQRLALDAFGDSVFSYRLPSMLAGVLALWLFYPLGRHLVGRGPAWLATLLLAVHPLHVFYSRFARAYTLVFLLALVLVYCLVRALEGRRVAWLGAGLAAAFLPWMHLSTAGTVASLAVVAVVLAWRQRPGPALRLALLTCGAAGALGLALFAPAADSLIASLQWLATLRGKGSAGFTDVLAVLGGSVLGGWVMALGSATAGILLARRHGPRGAILLTALVAPPSTIWLSDTLASSLAYARYQFVALVPLLLGSAWALGELLRRIPVLRGGPTYALGLALVILQVSREPIPLHALFDTFSNQPYWVIPQPELTRPFAATPEIYRQLARSPRQLTIVEYPLIQNSGILLDNYQRQHRQRTLVGLTNQSAGVYSRAPYVSLLELDPATADVDCVIVHKDLRSEVERFYGQAAVGCAKGHPGRKGIVLAARKGVARLWGEPTFEDEFVMAWMLERR